MAIPFGSMMRRKMAWGKLGSEAKRVAKKAAAKWAQYRKKKEQIREISILIKSLGIPSKNLKEHFEMHAKNLENAGKSKNEIFDIVIQDLQKMKQLARQTKPITEPAIITNALRGSLKNKPMTLAEVIQRMEEKVQETQ